MVAGFVVRIPEAIYTEMAAHVVAGFPNEACGALGTKDGRAYPSQRDKEWAKRNKLYYIIFSHQYYPEPPYARVYSINEDDSVIEGKIVRI